MNDPCGRRDGPDVRWSIHHRVQDIAIELVAHVTLDGVDYECSYRFDSTLSAKDVVTLQHFLEVDVQLKARDLALPPQEGVNTA